PLIKAEELASLQKLCSSGFGAPQQSRNRAAALGVACLQFQNPVTEQFRIPGRKASQRRVHSLNLVSASLQRFEAFVFKIAGPHFALTHEHDANLVIELGVEFLIPFAPELDRSLR